MEILPLAVLLLVAGLGALVRGGPVERRGALMFAVAWLASQGLEALTGGGPWLFLIDLPVMVGLIALSWKSPKPWPVYACGFQMLVLATRLAATLYPDVDAGVMRILLTGFASGAILMLALNAWARPEAPPTK